MKTDRRPKEPQLKPLTFKDMPEDLIWRVKAKAAEKRMTLKAFVIEALERAIGEKVK